jgi:hypothetical protein
MPKQRCSLPSGPHQHTELQTLGLLWLGAAGSMIMRVLGSVAGSSWHGPCICVADATWLARLVAWIMIITCILPMVMHGGLGSSSCTLVTLSTAAEVTGCKLALKLSQQGLLHDAPP